ncbi:MAG: O-antigen ligase family protein [Oligoflexia bacterium]|nr:O-antigen ligase family protein [Oligoflexia bacterium]
MTSSQRIKSNIRAVLAKPLIILTYLYVVSLTCSMAGMEITAWMIALLFILYTIVDRISKNKHLEFHTIGIELPLLIFIIVVICGLKINAPEGDFWFALGSLRNLVLLVMFTYSLQLVRNLNRVFAILVGCASLIAIYGIWQHFSGIDLWRLSQRALVQVNWGDQSVYSTVGFFSHHLTYGHSFMMILCLPWAALLLSRRNRWWQIALFIVSFLLIFTSIIFTYGRGAWIALLVCLPMMAFFASRKLFFITVTLLAISGGGLLKFDSNFRERALSVFAQNYNSNEERKQVWQANMAMFHDHPWIGVGYRQNEPLTNTYYKKLGIPEGLAGHAHSNYVELLSTTGILGFSCYMLFILAFVLMTARLFSTIPTTHYWHRVFALSALGAQLAFHVGGLTQWNFGDAEVQHQFIFWLAVVAYMSQRYYAHIVPDDQSL